MSNRDYYGDNVPARLSENNESITSTLMDGSGSNQYTQQPSTDSPPRYQEQPQRDNQLDNKSRPGEEERGLGATVIGGAGGAFVGHKIGKKSDHGVLGTVGGAIAGAVVANFASNIVKGHHGRGGGVIQRRKERLERRLDRLS
ncbi:hypothetical protein BJX99DRAFT_253582 [Aspergillus californicus]